MNSSNPAKKNEENNEGRGAGGGGGVTYLHPKYVFRRVSPEKRPLAAVPLEEVVRERHFAARYVGALVFHDSPALRLVSSWRGSLGNRVCISQSR